MFNRDHLRAKVLPQLRPCIRVRGRGSSRRPVPGTVYALLDALRVDGVELLEMRGPWRAGPLDTAPFRRRSRAWPACTALGNLCLLMDSEERAQELAGLLNWCEIEPSDFDGQ